MTRSYKQGDAKRILGLLVLAHLFFLVLQILQKRYLIPAIEPHIPDIAARAVSQILIPIGLIMPLAYFLFVRRLKPVPLMPKDKPRFSLLAKILVIQCGLIGIMSYVNLAVMIFSEQMGQAADSLGNEVRIDGFTLFVLLLFNPVVEEWIARKLTLERLRPLGEKKAIVYSALFFGVLHLFSQGLGTMFATFAVSLLWAWITLKTGRLIYAIVLHALMNLYAFFLPQWFTKTQAGAMFYALFSLILMPLIALVIYVKNRETFQV